MAIMASKRETQTAEQEHWTFVLHSICRLVNISLESQGQTGNMERLCRLGTCQAPGWVQSTVNHVKLLVDLVDTKNFVLLKNSLCIYA